MADDETKTLLAQLLQRLEAGQPATTTAAPAAPAVDYDQLGASLAKQLAPMLKPAPVSTGRPISDYGSTVGTAPIVSWRHEIGTSPISMSKAARRMMDMELGVEVARRTRLAAGQIQAEGIRVKRPRETEGDVVSSTAFDFPSGSEK